MNWALAKELKEREPCEDVDSFAPKGYWEKEYLSNKNHDCSYCHREICPEEFYIRTAILERQIGNRGTIVVYKKCKEHF